VAKVTIDARGLKCPMPALKMTAALTKKEVVAGDVLEVVADCPTFEKDVKVWCGMYKKVLVMYRTEGATQRCQIQC